jgi:hypothetical protein
LPAVLDYYAGCGALTRGDGVPSEDIENFLAIARKYLANAYTNIALEPLTFPQQAEMWSLIYGVEAAMKMRGVCLAHELEQVDRELEGLFRSNSPARLPVDGQRKRSAQISADSCVVAESTKAKIEEQCKK